VKGNADAVRLRREIADQMSEIEIATAQRAARDWLRAHSSHAQAAVSVPRPACNGGLGVISTFAAFASSRFAISAWHDIGLKLICPCSSRASRLECCAENNDGDRRKLIRHDEA